MNLGSRPFYDLCINFECFEKNYRETMEILLEYGYNTIAVNHIVDIDEYPDDSKKKKKGEQKGNDDVISNPKQVIHDKYSRIKVLNRLTVMFSEKNIQKMIKSTNYNKYDLVALLPLSQAAFQFVLGTLEADILSFGYANKIKFKLNRKVYHQLTAKGFHFELSYNPLIVDAAQRRNCIYLSHLLHSYGKSRNIIVSSGASKYNQIRSPYDVINLGFILGLSEQAAKDALTHCPEQVYLNAVGRRHGKTIAYVEKASKEHISEIVISDSDEIMESEPALKKQKACSAQQ